MFNKNFSSGSTYLDSQVFELFRYHGIGKNDTVLTACSGGIDSSVLLHCALRVSDAVGCALTAAHINHMLRGKESDTDEAFVRSLASRCPVPFLSRKVDVPALVKKEGLGIEEAARQLRYAALADMASQTGASVVLLGHTADDVVETFLFHLFRGAFLQGLSPMENAFIRGNILFLRPLLSVWRNDIHTYALEHGITYRNDSSNTDTRFTRNFIRHELLPAVKKNTGRNIGPVIERTAQHFKELHTYLRETAHKAYEQTRTARTDTTTVFSKNAVLSLSYIVFCEMIHIITQKAQPELCRAVYGSLSGKAPASNAEKILYKQQDITVTMTSDHLILRELSDKEDISPVPVRVKPHDIKGTQIYTFKNHTAALTRMPPPSLAQMQLPNLKRPMSDIWSYTNWGTTLYLTECLSLDSIESLELRMVKTTDTILPIGFTHHKKVKDLLIDEKVPRSLRNGIPGLFFNGECAWIVGYRISSRFKITPETKTALKIDIELTLS